MKLFDKFNVFSDKLKSELPNISLRSISANIPIFLRAIIESCLKSYLIRLLLNNLANFSFSKISLPLPGGKRKTYH